MRNNNNNISISHKNRQIKEARQLGRPRRRREERN